MSTNNVVSTIFEGAFWIRSKYDNSVLAPDRPSADGTVPLGGRDKFSAKQSLTDYSQMWLVEPQTDGVSFIIRNAQSGNIMDVKGSKWKFEWVNDDNGAPLYRIVNVHTNKYMTNNGDTIVSNSLDNTDQQHFALDPVALPPIYWISHAKTGWFLQYNKSDGSLVVDDRIPSAQDNLSQLWFLEPEPDSDAYMIGSIADETKVLDVSGSGTADGTPVDLSAYQGGQNQQWLINEIDASDPGEDRVKMTSVLSNTILSVVEGPTHGTLQISQDKGGNDQTWRLTPYPFPSVYWQTLQNMQTGTFLKQDGSTVKPSSGMANAVDTTVQWRFVPDGAMPHHFTLINRATGQVVVGKDVAPTVGVADAGTQGQNGLWALEPAGDGIAIVNTTTIGALDHYGGGSTITAEPRNGIDSEYHHWLAVQVADRLPSFAIVNNRTGSSLAFKSTGNGGVVMSANTVNDWSNQWLFQKLSAADSETPNYAIINKMSGMVLDHWAGQHIEASNDDTDDTHHQWKLLPCPCGENYFQIQNVATGHYLEEVEDNVPNATSAETMNMGQPDGYGPRAMLGTRLLPYIKSDVADTLRHRIVERAPGKDKKGKNKDQHKPQNPNLMQNVSPIINSIFGHLIDEWVEDRLPTTVQAGTRVSTTRREVEQRWGIIVPRSLQVGSERDGWIRIDIQGTYDDPSSPTGHVANIQGQWNNDSLFHVIVPVGINVGRVGREVIRGAMRHSLAQHTSVTVETANSKPPSGGKKPKTTPPPPPGPGGPGNGWVYTTAVLTAVALSILIVL